MMGRALSLAAASLFCCLAASPGLAQQNLDAGKSPAQIFNGNCGACHRSAKGLLKTVSPSSLPDFLRQHYTTGGEMAQMLSGYLTSNRAGAAEPDGAGRRARPQGANLRPDAPIGGAPDGAATDQTKPERRPRAATAKPDEAGIEQVPAPLAGKRRPRPDATTAPAGVSADEAGAGAGPAPGGKTRQSKRGKRGEPPVTPSAPDVAAKPDGTPSKEAAPAKDTERSIDARVPVPEPVDLPPPTAADIKPADVKPAEAKPEPAAPAAAAAERPSTERASEAPHTAPSPAEAAAAPGGPPTPPISR